MPGGQRAGGLAGAQAGFMVPGLVGTGPAFFMVQLSYPYMGRSVVITNNVPLNIFVHKSNTFAQVYL